MPPLKTERFEMRLDPSLMEDVDTWRQAEEGTPSRAEAIRQLVELALADKSSKRVPTMSDGERLILMMLCDLTEKMKIDGDFDPAFIRKAVIGGHFWALEWEYDGLFHGHSDKPSRVKFVVDVLDMWSFLEEAMEKLSDADKAKVAESPMGSHVMFWGFDGNHESEYMSIARFLTEDMDRFSRFKTRGGTNSHSAKIGQYRRMLTVFEPIRAGLIGRSMSAAEIAAVLEARAS